MTSLIKMLSLGISGSAILLCFLCPASATANDLIGVSDPLRAEYNWVMHCRGCHGVGAKGSNGGAPNMVGEVAQFLQSVDGRAFLGRVPGVAFVDLPDHEVADLLNWLIITFDSEGMPKKFTPYTAGEINQLRKNPLVSQAFNKRKEILDAIARNRYTTENQKGYSREQ